MIGEKGKITKKECCRINMHLKVIYKGRCAYCGEK